MVYWVATALSGVLFAVPGVALLLGVVHFVTEMHRLGYPGYFLPILGVMKLAGAAVILVPRTGRLTEWAYAGMCFDALCATLSHLAMGDGALQIVSPILIGALVLTSWATRPVGKTRSRPQGRYGASGIGSGSGAPPSAGSLPSPEHQEPAP